MNKNKLVNIFLTIAANVLIIAAIVGASFNCMHALTLLAPAILASIYPIITLSKTIKRKLHLNSKKD